MRKALFLILAMLIPTLCLAQDVVFQAGELTWDMTPEEMAIMVAEGGVFPMYCTNAPGVTTDPANKVGETAAPNDRWPITLGEGDWYCATSASIPSTSYESGLSNEWYGRVVSLTPGNLRLVPVALMLGDPLYLLGEAALASACLD